MKSLNQLLVFIITVQCLKIVTSKPLFKGLTFKKNYEVEISAVPFKHLSFIKEKWFPFKMIGVKHDIAKRQVDPKTDHFYSINEVTFDNEESDKFPGLLTSVKQNLDLNSEGEVIQNPAPVEETVSEVPIIDPKTIGAGLQKSPVLPINPSIIIAPSIQTAGNFVQTAAVVTSEQKTDDTSVPTEVAVEPAVPAPVEETPVIQPMHTHVDVSHLEKVEEGVSKLHTDISSVVPLNALVAAPGQETLSEDAVKVETTATEAPKVVEEVKVEPSPVPIAEPPTVVETPAVTPTVEPTRPILGIGGKTGPGLLMRGTRFMLYFGSVMLQVLSQMLSGSPPNLNQLTEPLALS